MTFGATSVRARLTLWHTAALGFIVLTFSLGIYFTVRSAMLAELDRQLTHATDIVGEAATGGTGELFETEEHGSISLFEVIGKNGVVYNTQAWAKTPLQNIEFSTRARNAWSESLPTGELYRIHSSTARGANDTVRVIVAQDERPVRQSLRSLAVTMVLGFPGALALALVGGYVLAG